MRARSARPPTSSRRRLRRRAAAAAALSLLLLGSLSARAGGLYVNEFATTSQGNAGAGRGAWVPDASATLHNAAAMTRLGDHAFSTGFGAFLGQIEFDTESDSPSGSGNGGDQFGFVPVSSFSYVHRLSDRLRFGLSFYSLGGAKLDPSNNWGGRFEMVEISLLTISASPVVALRLTDWLSIGGGPLLSYAILNWDLRAAGPLGESTIQLDDLDDFEPAARAGVLFHPSEDFGLSVSYLSKTDFKVSGDIDLPFGVRSDIDLDLPFPELVEVSAFWNVTDRLTLLATFNWEDWSTADDLSVTLGPLTTDAATGFKDTYKGILGANYRLGEKWLIQGGVSYDTSALRSRDRTTALPVDEQIRGALGVQHRLRPNLSVGFSFVYVNMGQGTVRGETVRGDYDRNDLFLFGVNLDFGRLWWSGRATL